MNKNDANAWLREMLLIYEGVVLSGTMLYNTAVNVKFFLQADAEERKLLFSK